MTGTSHGFKDEESVARWVRGIDRIRNLNLLTAYCNETYQYP